MKKIPIPQGISQDALAARILDRHSPLSDGPYWLSEKEYAARDGIKLFGPGFATRLLEEAQPVPKSVCSTCLKDLTRFKCTTLQGLGDWLNGDMKNPGRIEGVSILLRFLSSKDPGETIGALKGISAYRRVKYSYTTSDLGLEGVSAKVFALLDAHRGEPKKFDGLLPDGLSSTVEELLRDLGEVDALKFRKNPFYDLFNDALRPIHPQKSFSDEAIFLANAVGKDLNCVKAGFFPASESIAAPVHALVVLLENFIDQVSVSDRGFDGGRAQELERQDCIFPAKAKLEEVKKQLRGYGAGKSVDETWLRALLRQAKLEVCYLRDEFDTHFETHGDDG